VDSPIGAGFSYSDDPRDRVFNESVLAADLLDFMEEFLEGAQSPVSTVMTCWLEEPSGGDWQEKSLLAQLLHSCAHLFPDY